MNLAEFIESRRQQHLGELYEFLRIPSVSAKSEHKPDIDRASKWVADRLRAAGFKTVEIVPTGLHPLVYAESLEAPGKPTVLFYGHYDVQPAEPLELWTSPAFQPEVRNGNIFGRGTADDKGQVHIHIKALESLHQLHGKFPVNVKVLIEGEEEVGSVSLWDYVQSHKEKLKADALLVSDTSMLGKGAPSITYGLRGLNYYEIELTGPARDLHSGVYGGAVPNPLTILTELFSKLHDKNFRAVGAPAYDGEKGFTTVERLWIRPTLELNGIWGGYQGEGAKTVIPSKAYAKFSTRLVPNQNPQKIAKLVEKHIRKLLPKGVHCRFEVLSTGKPWVAAYKAPIFQVAQSALQKGFGKKAVFIREGGSIPFVTQMHDTFKVPCVLIGFGLPDENAHAPDEHLALENYYGGIKAIAHLYEDLAQL